MQEATQAAPKTVVDIHYRHIRGAGIQHSEQRSYATEACAVAVLVGTAMTGMPTRPRLRLAERHSIPATQMMTRLRLVRCDARNAEFLRLECDGSEYRQRFGAACVASCNQPPVINLFFNRTFSTPRFLGVCDCCGRVLQCKTAGDEVA